MMLRAHIVLIFNVRDYVHNDTSKKFYTIKVNLISERKIKTMIKKNNRHVKSWRGTVLLPLPRFIAANIFLNLLIKSEFIWSPPSSLFWEHVTNCSVRGE